jgi:heme exporter protein B
MQLLQEIKWLIYKDLKLEWRNRYAFNGIMLYILLIVFIIFLSFKKVDANTWNTLLWIILLFASVNGIAKSFIGESRNRDIYYYTLASPQAVILSKMIYNLLLMVIIAFVSLATYSVVLGFPVKYPVNYIITIFLGAIGFATTFTMVAGIASRAENNTALMTILSLPVFLPMLILILNVSQTGFKEFEPLYLWKNFALLALMDIVVAGMSLILFPYIWRD